MTPARLIIGIAFVFSIGCGSDADPAVEQESLALTPTRPVAAPSRPSASAGGDCIPRYKACVNSCSHTHQPPDCWSDCRDELAQCLKG